ncbi:uncharacterized protein LOC106659614 [Trichogramma pretiosum]|uniref:uncharacterized protein LOC106659614 n=1 Tax=Trichogramma pretiosum TaxID=7493 RepID=UPI0006C9C94C|nr:uncharacterized protein LOC106659614 [Trichogramma pretiosum]
MAQNQVESLQAMLRRVDWKSEESRHEFLCQFDSSIDSFNEIDSYKTIFRRGQIDRLLIDCMYCPYGGTAVAPYDDAYEERERFIQFVIRIGYRDEPEIQLGGPRTMRRTTAIHHAATRGYYDDVEELFKIYVRFDANYTDDSGLTHLHAASMAGAMLAVRDFILHKHDIERVWPETGETPLLLALNRRHDEAAVLLILNKAKMQEPVVRGVSAVELVVARNYEDRLVQYLFDYSKTFMRTWTRDALEFMAKFELSEESCEIVVRNLKHEDWWNICVAAHGLYEELYAELARLVK